MTSELWRPPSIVGSHIFRTFRGSGGGHASCVGWLMLARSVWLGLVGCFGLVACATPTPPVARPAVITVPRAVRGPLFGAPDISLACPPGFYNDLSQRCVPIEIADRHEDEEHVIAKVPESNAMIKEHGFAIDIHEVTTAQYTACVEAKVCTPAQSQNYWERRGGAPSKFNVGDQALSGMGTCNFGKANRADHPINCVTFEQSQTYCAWVGKRLPTGKQWVEAAAGKEKRTYPWGDRAPGRDDLCWGWLYGDTAFRRAHPAGTCLVDSHPKDRTPEGVMNMASGVSEWTDEPGELEDPYPRMNLAYKGPYHTVRGGSWDHGDAVYYKQAAETHFGFTAPYAESDIIGFRCAKSDLDSIGF